MWFIDFLRALPVLRELLIWAEKYLQKKSAYRARLWRERRRQLIVRLNDVNNKIGTARNGGEIEALKREKQRILNLLNGIRLVDK